MLLLGHIRVASKVLIAAIIFAALAWATFRMIDSYSGARRMAERSRRMEVITAVVGSPTLQKRIGILQNRPARTLSGPIPGPPQKHPRYSPAGDL